MPRLDSMLLASTAPERLRAWYVGAFSPDDDARVGSYQVLQFGSFHLMIDNRDDVDTANPEPGRAILNFDVTDARDIAARMDRMGTRWLSPLQDRDGSLFATAIDPDGNYVQVIQLSEEHKAAMVDSAQ